MMDNRVFNVNGSSREMFDATIKLAFEQQGERTLCRSWRSHNDYGLVLLWWNGNAANNFPVDLDYKATAEMAWQWLHSENAKHIKQEGWDANADHDGSNSKGWRVYVEDWGHIGDDHAVICAVKPAYMWHGK